MKKVDEYLNLNENQYCVRIEQDIQQIKNIGKLNVFIDYINQHNVCDLQDDLFTYTEPDETYEYLIGQDYGLAEYTREFKIQQDKIKQEREKKFKELDQFFSSADQNQLDELLLEYNEDISEDVKKQYELIGKIKNVLNNIDEDIKNIVEYYNTKIASLKIAQSDKDTLNTIINTNWSQVEKQSIFDTKKRLLIELNKSNNHLNDFLKNHKQPKNVDEILEDKANNWLMETFNPSLLKVSNDTDELIKKIKNKENHTIQKIKDHKEKIKLDQKKFEQIKRRKIDKEKNKTLQLAEKTLQLAHETKDIIDQTKRVIHDNSLSLKDGTSFDPWDNTLEDTMSFAQNIQEFSTLEDAQKFKDKLQRKHDKLNDINNKSNSFLIKINKIAENKAAKAKEAADKIAADKEAKAEAARIKKRKAMKNINIPEKKKEMLLYKCIIQKIWNTHPDLVNDVFKNHVKDRESDYKGDSDSDVLISLKVTLDNYDDIDDIDEILKLYQKIKNDFEIFKGPVRVYLKLRKFLEKIITDKDGKIIKTGDDKNKVLFEKSNPYTIRAKDICYKEVDQDEHTIEEIKNMVSNNIPHNFSRIYYGDETVKRIFEDSIQETVDNIVPLNANAVIMAYGPSGSGKTFNLIGDNFDHPTKTPVYGIIYQVLKYLSSDKGYNISQINDNKINKIEISSWQYYMYCGTTGTDNNKVKTFQSLGVYDENIVKLIKNKTTPHKEFVGLINSYINNITDYVYKFERSDQIISTETKIKNGIQYFPELVFDDLESNIVLYTALTGKAGVKIEQLEQPYDVDKSIQFEAGIDKTDFDFWNKYSNYKNGQFVIGFSLLREIQLGELKYLTGVNKNKKGHVENYHKKIKKYKFKVPNKVPDDNKELFLNLEAKLILVFAKRFYEFGLLTSPKFDILLNKTNNKMKTAIELDLENNNYIDIQNIFTKFYLALVRTRPTRATGNNPDSSRTHLVVNIKIYKNDENISNLKFVDLAGNEKADENYFQMRKEGNGITGSLLAIKALLKAKQDPTSSNIKAPIDEELVPKFFTTCKTTEQQNSCKSLYNKCIKAFETNAQEEYKLLDLDNENTTVSMYLNLPTYLKKGGNMNQCGAIADSLYFIKELQEKTKISKQIKDYGNGLCKEYNLEIAEFGRKRRRSRRGGSAKRSRVRKGYTFVKFKKSTKSGKKYDAVFQNAKTGRTKTISFGSKGMSDYTKHKDNDRKYQYLKRHRKRENWNNLMTAGALSRWVLWNKKSLKASMADYKKRFNGR